MRRRTLTLLHTNDLHGRLTDAAAASIAELRGSADLYFDSGDAVKSGNVAIPVTAEPVWARLRRAGCNASVPGNREFHVAEAGFRAKLRGAAHPVLAANLEWNGAQRNPLQSTQPTPLPPWAIIGDVGVFGIMLPMVTARMSARRISAFLNTSPILAAEHCVRSLAPLCSAIVCLSHLGLSKDLELATRVQGIDIILGGHSHDVLETPLQTGSTVICQAGSHARFVGRLTWDGGLADYSLVPLE